MGVLYSQLGKHALAIASIRRAIEIRPTSYNARYNLESANAYQNLGNAYREIGKTEEARAAFDMAPAIKPDNVKARWAKCIYRIPVMYHDHEEIEMSRRNYRHDLLELRGSMSIESPADIEAAAEAVGSQQPYSSEHLHLL